MARVQAQDFDTIQDALNRAASNFGATHELNQFEGLPKVYSPSGGGYLMRELYSQKGRYHWPRQGVRIKKLPEGAHPLVPKGGARENPTAADADYRGYRIRKVSRGFAIEFKDWDFSRGAWKIATTVRTMAEAKAWIDEHNPRYSGAEEARRGPACGPDVRKAGWVHRGGCHPARPLCRIARREKGLCYCTAYSYPHREGSGMCVQGPDGSVRFERHVHGPEREYEPEPEPIPEDESFGAWVRRNPARVRARECSCGVKENPVDENGIPWVKVERDPKIQKELVEIQDDFGPIAGSKDVYRLLSPWAVKQEQEHLLVVMTDIHSEIKGVALIHKGERDRVSVSPSDVLRPAVERSAAGLVLVHNHPSGRADHSKADADLTKAIREACDAANITFMDHVVLGTGEFYSFADKKLYKVKK